ncbi:sugar transporter [Methylosinus trichosporium OB3b]|uniref:Sugar transporter n=2 Tax=Methylocystaceae TaxID=31993 RepID=A0A2D2D322_METT3|nr:sugar transporter [Methylosinus trichosporium OB3b]
MAMATAGAIFSAGCEQSFDDRGRVISADFTGSTQAAEPASAETAQLANSVGSFVAAATPGNTAYKIGPQDVIEIVVFKVPELTRAVQVADTGSINLPLVGEFPVAGKTAQQVERELTAKLGATFLKSPQVSVYVKEFNSQRVTIEGAVKRPGVLPLRGKYSLLQVCALAEGLDRDVASSQVMVFRNHNGQRIAAEFDMDAIRDGHAPDPAIEDGDVIVVPTSSGKVALNSFLRITPALASFRPSVW